MPTCIVSIVTFNSGRVIADCLQSIPSDIPVVIVDNGSTDDTLAVVRQTRPTAMVIKTRRNLGFGRAHNLAIHRTDSDFILVLNPDTVLLPNCIAALLQAANRYPDSGLIGAMHQQPDGTFNSCFRNDMHCHLQLARVKATSIAGNQPPMGDLCVEQVSGALMLLRRSAIRKTGGFNKNIFMYFEDDDLCARLRLAGFSLVITPLARVIHYEGQSAGSSLRVNCIKGYHFERSRKLVYALYHGRGFGFRMMLLSHIVRNLRRTIRYRLKNDKGRAVYHLAGIKGLLS